MAQWPCLRSGRPVCLKALEVEPAGARDAGVLRGRGSWARAGCRAARQDRWA